MLRQAQHKYDPDFHQDHSDTWINLVAECSDQREECIEATEERIKEKSIKVFK